MHCNRVEGASEADAVVACGRESVDARFDLRTGLASRVSLSSASHVHPRTAYAELTSRRLQLLSWERHMQLL